ncbi:MAG TPA: bacterial transcriptional activator domain-containing protein, partial [Verrucomicrobiae bacterium]|nr:bacterial transcriptional activator domain-containing protein [Verrucomicrobiae bacterium]
RLIGGSHEEKGEWDDAVDCYLHALDRAELAEELYQRVMHCYRQAGRHGEIFSIYNRCRTTLAMHGIKPSPHTRSIFDAATICG